MVIDRVIPIASILGSVDDEGGFSLNVPMVTAIESNIMALKNTGMTSK
ncbi:hypothetical protein [uncultured Shewanella sp.]|nr:hypothetical protein [uncultured Shewanella sp.]